MKVRSLGFLDCLSTPPLPSVIVLFFSYIYIFFSLLFFLFFSFFSLLFFLFFSFFSPAFDAFKILRSLFFPYVLAPFFSFFFTHVLALLASKHVYILVSFYFLSAAMLFRGVDSVSVTTRTLKSGFSLPFFLFEEKRPIEKMWRA